MPNLPSLKPGRIMQAAALLLAVNLAFTACGGSSDGANLGGDETTATTTLSTIEATAQAPAETEGQGEAPTEESDGSQDVETEESETPGEPQTAEEPEQPAEVTGDVPGEALDFGPESGTSLAVVGVAFDDVLNFRAQPDPSSEILVTVAPTAEAEILTLGESWSAPGGVWWKVTVDGQTAWANQKFLGGAGAPTDIFADVAAAIGGLEFDSLEDAGHSAAATRASDDPISRIVLATEPLAFDAIGGFVIIDVLDLGDDSVKGERLRIEVEFVFDENGEEGAQEVLGVILTGVEATPICGRGVSEGFCV